MLKKINEAFSQEPITLENLKMSVKYGEAKNGTTYFYYDTFNGSFLGKDFSDTFKQFGATFDKYGKKWLWWVGTTANYSTPELMESRKQEIYNTKVVPFINAVIAQVDSSNGGGGDLEAKKQEILQYIEEALKVVRDSRSELIKRGAKPEDLEAKLNQIIDDIYNTFDDEEFMRKFEVFTKFAQYQDLPLSIMNYILAIIQDPEGYMIKPLGRWRTEFNKTINADYISIWLRRPRTKKKSKEVIDEITQKFLDIKKVSSVSDLNHRDKLLLERQFHYIIPNQWDWYEATDIRFTTQIEGTEEIISMSDIPDIKADEVGSRDENVRQMFEAGVEIAKVNKIDFDFEDTGTTKGYSANGKIRTLEHDGYDIGLTKTIFHELSHEILHQKYLNSDFYQEMLNDRDTIEQQAELSALLVMRNYGYKMENSLNYIALWGGNKSNIMGVFQSVCSVANYLIRQVYKHLNGGDVDPVPSSGDKGRFGSYKKKAVSESLEEFINKTPEIYTPEMVAKILGVEDIFYQYADENTFVE